MKFSILISRYGVACWDLLSFPFFHNEACKPMDTGTVVRGRMCVQTSSLCLHHSSRVLIQYFVSFGVFCGIPANLTQVILF